MTTRTRTYEWTDPQVVVAAALSMSGKDLMQTWISGELPVPPIVATLGGGGFDVPEPGRVVTTFVPEEFHYNPMGTVHGGVYSTVCDTVCGTAVQSMLPEGSYYTTLDLTIKFLRPATAATGRLTCEGRVVHLGRKTALAEATLRDDSGRPYASALSTCMILTAG